MRKKTGLLIFICLLFLIVFSVHSAQFDIETQNGMKLVITDVRYGHFKVLDEGIRVQVGQDLSGNPVYKYQDRISEFSTINQVEARVGGAFGFEFRLPLIPANDRIQINMVVKLPTVRVRRDLKSDTIITSFVFDGNDSEKVKRLWWEFRKENPKYHITGEWIISLFQSGRLLISQSFIVKQ